MCHTLIIIVKIKYSHISLSKDPDASVPPVGLKVEVYTSP